jgi:hypothetical protein
VVIKVFRTCVVFRDYFWNLRMWILKKISLGSLSLDLGINLNNLCPLFHRSHRQVHVTQQPQQFVANSFGMFNGEKLLHGWEKKVWCGCCGTHFTTLTDNRLLTRFEEYVCCSCCCDPAHNDSSLFLYDIAQLLESSDGRSCCLEMFLACCSCCCCSPKQLLVRGSFGFQTIYLSKNDVTMAKPAIAEAVARQKPNYRR